MFIEFWDVSYLCGILKVVNFYLRKNGKYKLRYEYYF